MTRRSKLWRVAAVLFVFINAAGAVEAAMMGQTMHAAGHVALLVLGVGAYLVRRFASRARRQNPPNAQLGSERLDYLQQSVDAIALEVERIGEAQRFNDKLRAERGETSPPNKPPPNKTQPEE
ncbi:MAG: hypothetical protein NVSMB53_04290 [Gemmatimonadaceae bacterium]